MKFILIFAILLTLNQVSALTLGHQTYINVHDVTTAPAPAPAPAPATAPTSTIPTKPTVHPQTPAPAKASASASSAPQAASAPAPAPATAPTSTIPTKPTVHPQTPAPAKASASASSAPQAASAPAPAPATAPTSTIPTKPTIHPQTPAPAPAKASASASSTPQAASTPATQPPVAPKPAAVSTESVAKGKKGKKRGSKKGNKKASQKPTTPQPSDPFFSKDLTLTLDYATRQQTCFYSAHFVIYWNDQKIQEIIPSDYDVHSLSFKLTAKPGKNVLAFEGAGISDSRGATLSNIKLIRKSTFGLQDLVDNGDFTQGFKRNWGSKIFKNSISGWKGKQIQVGKGDIYNKNWNNQIVVTELDANSNTKIEQSFFFLDNYQVFYEVDPKDLSA